MSQRKNKYFAYDKNGEKIYFGDYGTNESGISPVEAKVLVLPDEPSEQVGGLYKPERTREQEAAAQVRGLLVAMGGNCFEDWDKPIPEIGDRIMTAKYAGVRDVKGADGRSYQIIMDRDVAAILVEENYEETLNPRKRLGKAEQAIQEPDAIVVS